MLPAPISIHEASSIFTVFVRGFRQLRLLCTRSADCDEHLFDDNAAVAHFEIISDSHVECLGLGSGLRRGECQSDGIQLLDRGLVKLRE